MLLSSLPCTVFSVWNIWNSSGERGTVVSTNLHYRRLLYFPPFLFVLLYLFLLHSLCWVPSFHNVHVFSFYYLFSTDYYCFLFLHWIFIFFNICVLFSWISILFFLLAPATAYGSCYIGLYPFVHPSVHHTLSQLLWNYLVDAINTVPVSVRLAVNLDMHLTFGSCL